jgi:formate dehydrogenase subunit delta
MSPEEHTLSGNRKLAYMANQIAAFFQAMPHDEAVEGVAKHLNDFWEPRMRRHFFEMVDAGGEGLSPLVMEASEKVRRPAPPEAPQAAELSSTADAR